MPRGVVFQIAAVPIDCTFRVETDQATRIHSSTLPERNSRHGANFLISVLSSWHIARKVRLVPDPYELLSAGGPVARVTFNFRLFQKRPLIARYGIRATSARPGSGSLRLNTASTL